MISWRQLCGKPAPPSWTKLFAKAHRLTAAEKRAQELAFCKRRLRGLERHGRARTLTAELMRASIKDLESRP